MSDIEEPQIIEEENKEINEIIENKPKRKTKTKEPVDIEDIKPKTKPKKPSKIIIEDLKPEPIEEEPKKKTKIIEQIECPKCQKTVKPTTLRYHHEKTCPGEKINKLDLPVKKRSIKEKTPEEPKQEKVVTYNNRIDEQIKIKRESIKKLASNIA